MPRVATYIRVSREEQVEGYSLDAQIRAARDYCRLRGWPEPAVYADEGKSAYTEVTEKRPQFAAMLAAAEAGAHDVVIVHKLDRFARSLLVTLRELQRLERAGVAFCSISEAIDFTTPIGRVILSVLAAFAQYYSDNLSTEIKKGLREKEAQGGHVGGVPWPAVRVGGRLAIDPAREGDLALLLDLAARHSTRAVAAELNRRGIRPPRRETWWPTSVAKVVVRGSWLLDQPDPWPERWRRANSRPRLPRIASPDPVIRPLSGLMRCGDCGGAMQYAPAYRRADGGLDGHVRCRRCSLTTGRRAWGSRATAGAYEAAVEAWFLALPDLSSPRALPRPGGDARRAALAERRRSLVLALAEGLPEAEYRRRRAELDREEAALPPAGGQLVALWGDLPAAQAAWPTLPAADRNAIYRTLIEAVVIRGRACEVVPVPALAARLAEVGAG